MSGDPGCDVVNLALLLVNSNVTSVTVNRCAGVSGDGQVTLMDTWHKLLRLKKRSHQNFERRIKPELFRSSRISWP